MSYSTKEEVREMLKDDALNAIIGDTFIEDPAEREELVAVSYTHLRAHET